MHPCLDSLILTPQELKNAKKQVEEIAYRKWQAAGCPQGDARRFWLEAEKEWVEHIYVPHRYPPSESP